MTTPTPGTAGETLQRVILPAGEPSLAPLVARGGVLDDGGGGIRVADASTVSFDTYSAAFPGAWWRAATRVTSVTCDVTVEGTAVIEVHRSDERGTSGVVARFTVSDGRAGARVELPAPAGGWLWITVSAVGGEAVVSHIRWTTDTAPSRAATVTVAITTFDREADCLGVLRALSADSEVLASIDRVVVVDQGSRRLDEADGFAAASASLGERLRVIRQPNLGGSGGFSRGMLAAVAEGSEFVLLLDDDIRLEPESLRRMLAFATRTEQPTIVGAQMLSLVDPTVLHSFGETVDRRDWLWRPAVPPLAEVDLRTVPLTEPPLHRRVDVDFNGWWMCLVPTSVIREVGAALPLFIKWDDTEFALRAAAAGVSTVTLPGAAVWHMPWTAKDDGLDWQAYFQLRNRLVTALLHGRSRRETGVLAASLAQDVNHVLCLQYGSAAVRRAAVRDVLTGPTHLGPSLLSARGRAREILVKAGQVVVEEQCAESRRTTPRRPRGPFGSVARVARVTLHQLTAPRPTTPTRLTRSDGKWWAVGLKDSVAVDSAAGHGVFVGRRDRRVAVSLVRDAVAERVRLWWRWPSLAREYRAAAPGLASPAAWATLLERAEARTPPSVD